MRHAYRVYEFLKSRTPDIVISTQSFGTPYFALRARQQGVCVQRTRFVIVLAPFELQRRLNEGLVTSRPYTLIRFELERAVVQDADVCVAPSYRFVENAIEAGAASETMRFVVLPEIEVSGAKESVPVRYSVFIIPDVPPLERNIAFFAAVANRHPSALRDAEGKIRLSVAASDQDGKISALCRERFMGTSVEWTVCPNGEDCDPDGALLFVPYCEDFFAMSGALFPAVRRSSVLIGAGAAVGELFEPAGVVVSPFPDAVAKAIAEAADGKRALRVVASPANLETPWIRFFQNLAPPEPAKFQGTPRVTVCLMHFNRPKLVEAALSSALGQTYEHLETLIFDDGSDARGAVETLEALVETHGGRVRLVRQDNRYLGAARNSAARAANGEYVYFLDDDNVLKPHAIDTLVRAACTSGADFVGSFSDIFTGEDAPAPGAVAERRILQAGSDGGFALFFNTILDGNALCRRDAFLDLGGNTEDYGIGKEDQEFFARAIRSGRSVNIVPEALFWARHGQRGLKSMHVSRSAGHFRVLEAYWPVVDPRYRGLLLLLQGMFVERFESLVQPPKSAQRARTAPVMVPTRQPLRFCIDWFKGRKVVAAHIASARWPTQNRRKGFLSGLDAVSWWRARRIVGSVENRSRPEVRGWVLDSRDPELSRTVAIHVDGRLSQLVLAENQRDDIANWKGTDGRHGFLWRIPEDLASEDGTRIDVFDAETGRPLQGSPICIVGGEAITNARGGK